MSAVTAVVGRSARALPVGLAVATAVAQVVYPRVPVGARTGLTMVVVALFAAASVSHALVWLGWRWTLRLVLVTAVGGLLVEALGVAAGVPFGPYAYTATLRPQLLGVPWVIPLAWTMMAYPALVVARRVAGRGAAVAGPVLAAAALAAWDLFLDPQMVAAGHWVWDLAPGAPALLGVPLSNYAGWFATGLVMAAALWPSMPPPDDARDRLPVALYLWTWIGSAIAHAFYLDLPWSALTGTLGMGAITLLLARAELRRRRTVAAPAPPALAR